MPNASSDSTTFTIVCDNETENDRLKTEHGMSIIVETRGRRLLFDSGSNATLTHNAAVLGINLADVDCAVLSHGHYDHADGLASFFSVNQHATLHAASEALWPKYKTAEHYIGIAAGVQALILQEHTETSRFKPIPNGSKVAILPGVFALGPAPLIWPDDAHTANLHVLHPDASSLQQDSFEDERSLVIEGGQSLCLISGCSHRGILNIIAQVRHHFDKPISLVLGGLHLHHESEQAIRTFAERLGQSGSFQLAPIHCTGSSGRRLLAESLPDHSVPAAAGTVLHWEG